MKSDELRVTRVRDSIELYLQHHPDAADTANGVMNFWLPATCADATLADVVLALAQLVEQGRVLRSALPGGSVLYQRL